MEVAPELRIPSVRCSPFHGSLGADPIGSAGTYDAFLFVEVPLPWDRDITLDAPFAAIAGGRATSIAGADGRRWRPMGMVPEPGSGDAVAVLAFDRVDGVEAPVVSSLRRRSWSVAPGEVEELCRAVLAGTAADPEGGTDGVAAGPVADLFVCAHGRRDICCGSLGAAMHQDLRGAIGTDARRADGAVLHVARCSHTGGHRFAPTAITFPDGYAWAHLTAELAERLVRRTDPPAAFAAHCRGSSLLDGAPAQAADRVALVEVCWDWADAVRRAEAVAFERDTLATTVRVVGDLADGSTRSFEVRVELERHIPTPTCGAVDGPEFGVEAVWRVADARELDGPGPTAGGPAGQ
jgi:hypothetical protein